MTNSLESDDLEYVVLVNEEGQHSLWPAFREVPMGWEIVGPRGKRQQCLDWIEAVWTDLRPRSLVKKMNEESSGKS